MKIAFYCQHILGIGHLQRSLLLCSALIDRGHQVLLFLGGPETTIHNKNIEVCALPCLRMNENFGGLYPCDNEDSTPEELEFVKETRKKILEAQVERFAPDVFITELYPMGRKAFRFELDPLVKKLKEKGVLCIASVRDILVEKVEGQEKFENRALSILNSYYHSLIVHGDEKIIALKTSFHKIDELRIPLFYSGFIAPEQKTHTEKASSKNCVQQVVASIGGSRVGEDLLEKVVHMGHYAGDDIQLTIFCGKDSPISFIKELQEKAASNTEVLPFSSDFDQILLKADLSISMAGYNTCMNIVQTGTTALCLPFKQNKEQLLRVQMLEAHSNIHLLKEDQLAPALLYKRVQEVLQTPKKKTRININGAVHSAVKIEKWLQEVHHG